MSARRVAAFRGHAQCQRGSGAIQWSLVGVDRDSGAPLEVLLSGAEALQLPAQLAGAELYVDEEAGTARWELRSADRVLPTGARAVQVHRGVGAAFALALPRFAAPLPLRAGWWLLLNLLRLPGAARLLGWLRSRSAP
jgi:hypothetical protein